MSSPQPFLGLEWTTFPRGAENSRVNAEETSKLFERSYLLIRFVVGLIGIALPTALFIMDGKWLVGNSEYRDSLSAYYHTGARDLFVGALSVTGVLLLTYMAGHKRTWDFVLSMIAGLGLLGVAFIPTRRPTELRQISNCIEVEDPAKYGCVPLQTEVDENLLATLHFISTGVFIAAIALLCVAFSVRAKVFDKSTILTFFYGACFVSILFGVGWIFLGDNYDWGPFNRHPLYLGEVICVYAFGLAWTMNGRAVFNYGVMGKVITWIKTILYESKETRKSRGHV